MKITIESTAKLVSLVIDGHDVPARIWQGETEDGIPVQCFVTRIAPEIPESDPRIDELTAAFDRDLQRQAAPRPTIEVIPLRLIMRSRWFSRELIQKMTTALTDQQRRDLDAELTGLQAPLKQIQEMIRPYKRLIEAIDGCVEATCERYGITSDDILGKCEGCDRMLIRGDRGHKSEEGCLLCEECSPTYGDVKGQWEDPNLRIDEEERRENLVMFEGMSPERLAEKALYVLD